MRFKVLKDTELYDKLNGLQKKCNECAAASHALAVELGATAAYTTQHNRCGGADAFHFEYGKDPDKAIWMRPSRRDAPRAFYPRSGGKAGKTNKELLDKIAALPVISYEEANSIIGFEAQWVGLSHCRSFGAKIGPDYALVEVPGEAEYTPHPDMTELKESEYKELFAALPKEEEEPA